MIPYIAIPEFHFGPFTISIFGVTALCAVLLGSAQTIKRGEALGLSPAAMSSLLNHVLGWGFVGAHLVAVLVYHPERLRADPWSILKVWNGIASSGGILAGALATWFMAPRKGLNRILALDSLAYGLAPAWIFGRLGCSLVHDHPGAITSVPWAVAYPDAPAGMGRYDLGLYEIPVAIVLTIVMRALARRGSKPGVSTATFLAIYAPVRFGLDFLRAHDTAQPDPRWLGLTFAQYMAALVFVLACAWLVRVRMRANAVET